MSSAQLITARQAFTIQCAAHAILARSAFRLFAELGLQVAPGGEDARHSDPLWLAFSSTAQVAELIDLQLPPTHHRRPHSSCPAARALSAMHVGMLQSCVGRKLLRMTQVRPRRDVRSRANTFYFCEAESAERLLSARPWRRVEHLPRPPSRPGAPRSDLDCSVRFLAPVEGSGRSCVGHLDVEVITGCVPLFMTYPLMWLVDHPQYVSLSPIEERRAYQAAPCARRAPGQVRLRIAAVEG